MYYIMYLSGLCERRRWPEPHYEFTRDRKGWQCKVRVNNREYTSGAVHAKEHLAKEAAASRAYSICRDFSVNDGMYPGQRQGHPGVVQGLPVAIGTGRRSRKSSTQDYSSDAVQHHHDTSTFYEGDGSRGSSPRSSGSELDTSSRRSSKSSSSSAYHVCVCQRAYTRSPYERCGYCVQEAGAARYY